VTLIAGCGSLQRRGRQHHGTLPAYHQPTPQTFLPLHRVPPRQRSDRRFSRHSERRLLTNARTVCAL
jgi:hypothetical protein